MVLSLRRTSALASVAGAAQALLMVLPATALAQPAEHATPDSATLAQLRADLGGARSLRATGVFGALVLERPVLGADGVHFGSAKGFPRPRPALIVGSNWDSVSPPPNPVPWSAVTRLERPVRRFGPAAVLGGGLGLWGGIVLGAGAAYIVGYSTNSTPAAAVTMITMTIAGAVIGGWAMGESSDWQQVYPAH